MTDQKFHIDNAEERAVRNPKTFQIPPKKVRETLRPGDLAKLIFKDRAGDAVGERMWVRIQNANNGRYAGVLDNDPAELKNIKDRDPVEFGPEHICAVERASDRALLN